MESSYTKSKALYIAEAAADKKAEDVVVLDVQKISGFCDYFVIASASSLKKTKAISDYIADTLAEQKIKPRSIQGKQDSQWILLDYNDVVVHIFYHEIRAFYNLEKLWSDAKKVDISA